MANPAERVGPWEAGAKQFYSIKTRSTLSQPVNSRDKSSINNELESVRRIFFLIP